MSLDTIQPSRDDGYTETSPFDGGLPSHPLPTPQGRAKRHWPDRSEPLADVTPAPRVYEGPAQRLDKWLVNARFFKTRGEAARRIADGMVRIDGCTVSKSHASIRVGQVLTFQQARHIRLVKVAGIADKRGPARDAIKLYLDLDPPNEDNALPHIAGAD